MNIVIRKATKDDYKEIITLYADFVNDQKRFANFDNDSYQKVISDNNARIFVANIGSSIIGFISCTMRSVVRYPRPVVEIEELFVAEKHRRKKIGQQLVKSVIAFAKEQNCSNVFVSSALHLKEAHAFYRVLGFEEYEIRFRKKLLKK